MSFHLAFAPSFSRRLRPGKHVCLSALKLISVLVQAMPTGVGARIGAGVGIAASVMCFNALDFVSSAYAQSAVEAQTQIEAQDGLVAKLASCRQIASADARLSCFDTVAAGLGSVTSAALSAPSSLSSPALSSPAPLASSVQTYASGASQPPSQAGGNAVAQVQDRALAASGGQTDDMPETAAELGQDGVDDYEAVIDAVEEKAAQSFGFRPEDVDEKDPEKIDPARAREMARAAALEKAARGPDEIVAQVTRFQRQSNGAIVVLLDNGQLWQETSPGYRKKLKAGDTVTIKKSGFGGFRLSSDSKRGFARVRRVK